MTATLPALTRQELARRIDHALLQPWATVEHLQKALEEVRQLGLRCLITTPVLARIAIENTSDTCIGAVVGFPYGYSTIESKIKELEDVIGYGVKEVDIVVNYHAYLAGRKEYFENEVKALTAICRETGVTCKLIIESTAYDTKTLIEIVRIVSKYEPHYVKTSTGYGPRPTHPEDVLVIDQVLRKEGLRDKIGIKAAGGIRTRLQALLLIAVGADIIGTSKPAQVLEEPSHL